MVFHTSAGPASEIDLLLIADPTGSRITIHVLGLRLALEQRFVLEEDAKKTEQRRRGHPFNCVCRTCVQMRYADATRDLWKEDGATHLTKKTKEDEATHLTVSVELAFRCCMPMRREIFGESAKGYCRGWNRIHLANQRVTLLVKAIRRRESSPEEGAPCLAQ